MMAPMTLPAGVCDNPDAARCGLRQVDGHNDNEQQMDGGATGNGASVVGVGWSLIVLGACVAMG